MSRDPESHKGTIKAIQDSFNNEEQKRDYDFEAQVKRLLKNLDQFVQKDAGDGSTN